MGKRKSYTCQKLGGTLNFLPEKINFCCSCAEGPNIKYKKGKKLNLKKILSAEKSFIRKLKYGFIPFECLGCIDYVEKNYNNIFDLIFAKSDTLLITDIIVNHFKQCDCNCIYCAQKIIWGEKTGQNYELLPLIKELYKKNAIDTKKLRVEFQGGNVSVLNEFEPLMKEFLSNGCKKFLILTNGIKYLPIIEEASFKSSIELHISLDCGTKETFKKIKRVDAFEQVINNIKEFGLKTNAVIGLKYILLKGINDNQAEVESFLEIVKNLRCIDGVCFDIDYRDILLDKGKQFDVPKHYYEIIENARNYFKGTYTNVTIAPYANQYMEKYKQKSSS